MLLRDRQANRLTNHGKYITAMVEVARGFYVVSV